MDARAPLPVSIPSPLSAAAPPSGREPRTRPADLGPRPLLAHRRRGDPRRPRRAGREGLSDPAVGDGTAPVLGARRMSRSAENTLLLLTAVERSDRSLDRAIAEAAGAVEDWSYVFSGLSRHATALT